MSSPQEQSDNVKDESKGSSPLNNVASVMAQSIEGMQSTMGTVYTTMATNLRQSLEMTQTMNSVMEHFLRISVRTKTVVTDEEGKPCLALILSNTSQIPVSKALCQIEFKPRNAEEEAPFDLEHMKSSTYTLPPKPSSTISIAPVFETSITSKCVSESITLEPFSAVRVDLALTPPLFTQYIVAVTVNFPSPGTGKMLSTRHEFGLYLVHQCVKTFLRTCDLAGSSAKVKVPLSPLRKLFRLSPAEGISSGTGFQFESNEMAITLVVSEFEKECTEAICEVYFLSNFEDNELHLKNLVEEIEKLYTVEKNQDY
ncbi:hypothetical protein K493DRAFT_335117 [Basidiobolus meristosporus CBS 931.73]|uniref:Uncharacterized protein n=1 Tax=Basidiobolus meristosporus CBS 931.73 TaxID=1314790 RepID=A0A1Y1YSQ7_9FUNG|nr:hypothetical protein K493DRAFT_335117 [Basidiobolus meristosporus CBS 931.73]|eukprot:ORY00999.1 hypothetical protein K493DRAFT_335117 [Basidiobolus meristosporus CBS 931.73]